MIRQPPAQHEVEQHGRAQRRGHRRRPHGDGSQRGEGAFRHPVIFIR